jgi:hypothetical protein
LHARQDKRQKDIQIAWNTRVGSPQLSSAPAQARQGMAMFD